MVVGTATIVMVVGLSALTAQRITRRAAIGSEDFAKAHIYAQSAIDLGLLTCNTDKTWRNVKPSGTWFVDVPFGRGTIRLEAVDPVDGNLSTGSDDPVVFTGYGTIADAEYRLSVQARPYGPRGLDVLAFAVHGHRRLQVNLLSSVTADAPLSTNDDVSNQGTITADVEASQGVINLGVITGTIDGYVAAKDMPDPALIDWYASRATVISTAQLNQKSGDYYMEKELLSPTVNPFGGGTNADGLYLIDCGGAGLIVSDTRIVGTLVVRNAGSNSGTEKGLLWEPARTDYPAMLIEGDFNFAHDATLSESSIGLNVNPSGLAAGGVSNATATDVFPSTVKGLCYLTDDLGFAKSCTFQGAIVVGDLVTVGSVLLQYPTVTVTHDDNLINNPPPGFEKPWRPMVPVAGSWARSVN